MHFSAYRSYFYCCSISDRGGLNKKITTMTKPYYLISTLSFNLKAFEFLNLIITQHPRRGAIELWVDEVLFKIIGHYLFPIT
jgi:hypothetical protein